jgi:hypothetical protein
VTEKDIQAWMADGYPTDDESYRAQPYKYSRSAGQKVLRIPISGPEPFNTLVLVRGYCFSSVGGLADDTLRRLRYGVITEFHLRGYDELTPPEFRHSTIAATQMMQARTDTPFVVGIDAVDGFFGPHGNWIVAIDIGSQWHTRAASSSCYYSSWVLCKEPPLPPGLP